MYLFIMRQHAATQPHNKQRRNFNECFNVNITLARFSALPDDGRRQKHVAATFNVYFNVNFNVFFKIIKVHLLVSEIYSERNVWSNL